jgi:glycosyltransferase involved in cell wall biosynthesis
MKIHLYAACWNERPMLDFFFRHYDQFVDRYIIHDDGSTDGSLDVLRAHPKVDLRRLDRVYPDSTVDSLLHLYNEGWKESRGEADWVIVTNIDEHLHHRVDLLDYVSKCMDEGVTYIPALGYQMMSDTFPRDGALLCEAVTHGVPLRGLSKLQLFNPDALKDINYGAGRHVAKPKGIRKHPERDELLLLHYKYLGPEYAFQRHQELQTGLRKRDIANGWGNHYFWSEDEFAEVWGRRSQRLVDISDPGLEPWNSHPKRRWWRETKKKRPAAEVEDAERRH